jgi:hypothetical protein
MSIITPTTPAAPPVPAVARTGAAPGFGLGIAGFALSMLGALSPLGLVFSLVAFVKSRHAGRKNGLALAGIVIGAVGTVVLVVVTVAAIMTLAGNTEICSIDALFAQTCN